MGSRLIWFGLVLLLALVSGAKSKEEQKAAAKAVRMKTTRQLKEILAELKIKVPKDADKEDLMELALKHDAIPKWEELHPEKKKKPRMPGGGMPGGGMPGGGQESIADMMFPMSNAAPPEPWNPGPQSLSCLTTPGFESPCRSGQEW